MDRGLQEARSRIEIAARDKADLLDLRGLDLTEIPEELYALSHLTYLFLGSNDIGADGVRALATLPKLTWLDLAFNAIEDDMAWALSGLTGLDRLDLAHDCERWEKGIGDDGARALSSLTALTGLELRGNRIGPEGVRALTALTQLSSLDLSGNRIGDEGARALVLLPRMRRLFLSGCDISDEGALMLAQAWSGQFGLDPVAPRLDLWGNRISLEGARALAAAGLPEIYKAYCENATGTELKTVELDWSSYIADF